VCGSVVEDLPGIHEALGPRKRERKGRGRKSEERGKERRRKGWKKNFF
jgi:hypothetical protein